MTMAERASMADSDTSLCGIVDEIFGRWPGWPWSVLGVIACGGGGGFAVSRMLQATSLKDAPALGTIVSVGYGMAVMAVLVTIPRVVTLAMLWPGVTRRPVITDFSWWPLKLLTVALEETPQLRRTQQEFEAAVSTTATRVRSLLADRLWPVWVAAFVIPVLGLITAWQNGSQVQLQLSSDSDVKSVFPSLIAQTSPPMVASIAASLVVMVVLVVIDQCTKILLRRWSDVVDVGDGVHPGVVERLGRGEFQPPVEPSRPSALAPVDPPAFPTHPLNPDELKAMWQQSGSPDD